MLHIVEAESSVADISWGFYVVCVDDQSEWLDCTCWKCSASVKHEVRAGFWWGNLREREHLENPGCRWEDNIEVDLKEVGLLGRGLDRSAS